MKKTLFILMITTLFSFAADNFPPSYKHPGDLPLDSIPQFVCFGFDDNVYLDGFVWADSLFRSKTNPDGYPVRTTFYITSRPDKPNQPLWDAINSAYKAGHEIGNHTMHHNGEVFAANLNSRELWDDEINGCTDDLLRQSGVPKEAITGFRTPFLSYSEATFLSMVDAGLYYDCSIEHGLGQYSYTDSSGATQYACGEVWPYTMDDGPMKGSYATIQTKIPGFWQLPVHEFMPRTGWIGVTGLDWNVWFSGKKMPKDQVLDLWKSSLDIRFKGDSTRQIIPNRAPYFIGMHSDEYDDANPGNHDAQYPPSEDTETRKQTVVEFLDWLLAYDESIRVVPMKVVIEWMKNPVPYSQFHYNPIDDVATFGNKEIVYSKATPISINFNLNNFSISTPIAGKSKMGIYSVSGRKLIDLGTKDFKAGKNNIALNNQLSKGIYLIKLKGTINTAKLVTIQ